MKRAAVLAGFWFIGFLIGFFGYLASPSIGEWLATVIPKFLQSGALVGALLSGLIGSTIMVVSVIVWSRISPQS